MKDCGNPMTSKMVDWKMQTDLTSIKSMQYAALGKVLDYVTNLKPFD